MRRNRVLILMLFALMVMGYANPAYAQSTNDVNFKDILTALGPRSGQDLLFDILLYTIFFIGLVNSFLIPDKQLMASLLNFLVMGIAVVSKLLIGYPPDDPLLTPTDSPVLILNVAVFVIPLIIAGSLRSYKGKRTKAMMPAIFQGLIGGTYFFLFWALLQRNSSDTTPFFSP